MSKPVPFLFGRPDDESLPLTRCACGVVYAEWTMILHLYADDPKQMPCCGRNLYFTQRIEVKEA